MRFAPVFLVLAALAAGPAAAQTANVRGFVTDAADGQPLIGANVVVQPVGAAGGVRGAATDTDGFYAVVGLAPGRYALRVSSVGYETLLDTLVLEPGTRPLDLALSALEGALGEATVEGDREGGSADVDAGLQRIRPVDVRAVPAPDVSGDLANYLVSLSGVVTSGDRGGQLFIRGGEPTQNQVFLDGIPIFQPFHVLGFYSAFPADLLQTADLYAGGYDAGFGGQLSSVLDVSARTGNLQRFAASASVAPFVASASAEGPLVRDRLSLLASGRVSTVEQIAARYVRADLPFVFGDVFAKLYYTPTATSRFSVTGLRTWDRGGIGDPGASVASAARADEVRYQNTAVGLRYLLLPSDVPFLASVHLSYSNLDTELGPRDPVSPEEDRALTRSSGIARFDGAVDLTYLLRFGGLRTGGFLRTTTLGSELGGLFQNVATASAQVTEAGLYLQPEFRAGGLRVSPGVRVTTLPQLGQVFVEPRLRAAFEAGAHRASVAAGLYNQPIVGVSDRRDPTSVFTAYTIAPDGQTPRAAHLIAGYHVAPTPWADLSVEAFVKTMDDLSVAEFTAVPRLTTALLEASGKARGLDLRAELHRGAAQFLVNYGLSFVEYTTVNLRNELLFGEETFEYRPGHDRRHQATVVASVPVRGFTVAARFQFGSGLPFSRALGFDQYLFPDGAPDLYADPGTPRVLYERPFNALLPDYHRLDVTVERVFPFRTAQLTVQAGLLNAYDRANLFAYDLFTLRRVDQLPVVPTLGLRLDTR
jgi:hypothetical protein